MHCTFHGFTMATRSSDKLKGPHAKKKKCNSCVEVNQEMKDLVEKKFLVALPQDFYDFWQFLCEIDEANPNNVLQPSKIRLGGPFDLLLGKSSSEDSDYLLHHRFFCDPPEFQTVIISTEENCEEHIGYYRDDPSQEPAFLALSHGGDTCRLLPLGDNLFAAVHSYILQAKNSSPASEKLMNNIKKVAKRKGYEIGNQTAKMVARKKKVVSKSFHTAGIVVPVDENGVGWREISLTDSQLKKLFGSILKEDANSSKSVDELQEIITYVQFANDECDYGQGLELGIDLFCYGSEKLHGYIHAVLPMAYSLLGYNAFETIILAHLNRRSRGLCNYLT
ncbi:histone PARylation factor 1-like [Watersipora subatra]|uniref:histone PARylation factor 1-like n=1 Tax=Watersipora subatra TaxID=2589382 RepID=UPI00355BF9DE